MTNRPVTQATTRLAQARPGDAVDEPCSHREPCACTCLACGGPLTLGDTSAYHRSSRCPSLDGLDGA